MAAGSNVCPRLTFNDPMRVAEINSMTTGNARHFLSRDMRGTDVSNCLRRQFCIIVPLSFLASMARLILTIFGGRGPSQIVWIIVGFAAIPMSYLVNLGWPFAMKCSTNTFVDGCINGFAVNKQLDLKVSIPIQAKIQKATPAKWAWFLPLNSAKVARNVIRREWYNFPKFFAIINVVHLALLMRCGQGRSLLKQDFRPTFLIPAY